MTHPDDQLGQPGNMDWDEGGESGHPGHANDKQRAAGRGASVQDQAGYGGEASGEGQGEFAGDGYSAQGQFTNQRVAQYGDQGYSEDFGREGIGWQNRDDMAQGDGHDSNGQSESRGQSQRDETKARTSSS